MPFCCTPGWAVGGVEEWSDRGVVLTQLVGSGSAVRLCWFLMVLVEFLINCVLQDPVPE